MDKGNVSHRHAARDSRGREGPGQQVEDGNGGKHMYDRWKPAGGGIVQVDECSTPGRFWGVEAGATERSGAVSNSYRWGGGRR